MAADVASAIERGTAWFSISEYPANKISVNANICSANIQYLQHF